MPSKSEAKKSNADYQSLLNELERPFIQQVFTARKNYGEMLIILSSRGKQLSPEGPETLAFQNQLFNIINENNRRIIYAFVRYTEILIYPKLKQPSKKIDINAIIRLWAQNETLKNVQSLTGTAFDDTIKIVKQFIGEEKTRAEITKAIQFNSGISKYRAATIARTESHKASNYATIQSGLDLEERSGIPMKKSWISAEDLRTRPDHADMDSTKFIPIKEKFIVGGEPMDRPGDPSASARNIINCRCSLGMEPDFDNL